jgi:hypothetical protein
VPRGTARLIHKFSSTAIRTSQARKALDRSSHRSRPAATLPSSATSMSRTTPSTQMKRTAAASKLATVPAMMEGITAAR